MPVRVRWGNVGRALGAGAVVVVVVAWPWLRGDAPVVPGGAAVPVEEAGRAPWRGAPSGGAGRAGRAGGRRGAEAGGGEGGPVLRRPQGRAARGGARAVRGLDHRHLPRAVL